MKLKNKILLTLFLTLLFSKPLSASNIEIRYEACRNAYQKLIKSNKKKMRHNWVKVIKCFENITETEKSSARVGDALFTLGALYNHLYAYSSIESDLNNSLRYYEKVSDDYPDSNLADDALLKRATIFDEIKKDYTKAYIDLSEILEKYKSSDSYSKAKRLMVKVKNKKPRNYGIKPASKPILKKQALQSNNVLIKEIKHWTNPDFTRVAIYMNEKTDFTYNVLDVDTNNLRPRRIYIDIKNAKPSADVSGKMIIKDGLLTRARIGRFKKDIARVVLDAEKEFEHTVVAWQDPFRIIIDIRSKDKATLASKEIDLSDEVKNLKPQEVELDEKPDSLKKKNKAKKAEVKKEEKKIAHVPLATTPVAKRSKHYIKRIVIDPGHGGEDTGAVGKYKTVEKNVVLEISKKLRDILSKDENIEVIMTREDDTFVPLEERTGMAVQAQADLFISIHADAHKNRKVRGVSTYFLGDTDDKDSIMTALMENYSTKDYVGAVEKKETKDFLSYTFVSLQKNYDAKRSIPLADSIQKNVVRELKGKYSSVKGRGVKQGIFWVLCGTNSPAVLIETSYISNPAEEKRLKSGSYQKMLAKGIAKGIREYLNNPVAMSGYSYLPQKKLSK